MKKGMSVISGQRAEGGFTHDAVLAVGYAVVGEEDEEGVLEEVKLLHLVEEVPQPAVHHRHLCLSRGSLHTSGALGSRSR